MLAVPRVNVDGMNDSSVLIRVSPAARVALGSMGVTTRVAVDSLLGLVAAPVPPAAAVAPAAPVTHVAVAGSVCVDCGRLLVRARSRGPEHARVCGMWACA